MNWRCWCGLVLAAAGLARAASPLVSTQTLYYGLCDASAAVALGTNLFAVANDEDNPIRLYHADHGGPPLQTFDFSKALRLNPKKPELDLEGACWLGERIFWITSHGRNRLGQYRPNRHRFFATEWKETPQGAQLLLAGRPYGYLVNDLIADPRLSALPLRRAALLPPKDPGGLNIEGLCATPEGALLLAFRNPLPQQKALLVPLVNPNQVITGKPARFGEPILLNLDGLGVRDLTYCQGQYVLIAGSADATGASVIYLWPGGQAQPRQVSSIKLPDFNPEAILAYPDRPNMLQLLSDDGTRTTRGQPCKTLPDLMQQRFRSLWITVPKNGVME